jgi:hypothetical protein
MKYLKLLAAIITSSCLLLACSGNSSSSKSNDPTPGNAATSGSSGDASFSATIDGTPVSGNEIDEMQTTNTAFIYPPQNNKPQTVLFFLYSTKKGDDYYSFRFSLPDKEGVYHATKGTYNESHSSVRLDFNLKSADNYARYDEDSVTVTIDKITSSQISGTFSGALTLSDDTRSKPYKSQVIVTDGKFDIPFSTGNVRPE